MFAEKIDNITCVCGVLIVVCYHMKTEGVGTITKSGGFSRVIRDVHDTGEPLQIIRHNEIVAMIVPANADLVDLFESCMNFGKALKNFADKGMEYELQKYLLGQIITGMQAKVLLATAGINSDVIIAGEEAIVAAMKEAIVKQQQNQKI